MNSSMDGLMDGGTTILGTLRHLTANSSRVVQYCWMLCGLIMKLLLCFGLPSLNYSTANGARLLYFAGVLCTFAPKLRLFRMLTCISSSFSGTVHLDLHSSGSVSVSASTWYLPWDTLAILFQDHSACNLQCCCCYT